MFGETGSRRGDVGNQAGRGQRQCRNLVQRQAALVAVQVGDGLEVEL